MDGCPECGFESMDLDREKLASDSPFPWLYDESAWRGAGQQVVDVCSEAAALLRSRGEDVRTRVDPTRWSTLEYACHIRDVLLIQRERVLKALRGHGDEPLPMGRDERVIHDGYNTQNLDDVAVQLQQSAILFVGVLDRLSDSDWSTTMTYGLSDSAMRSIRWVAVHTAHEAHHHLADMRYPS
jgi:hypothetical protein